MAHKRSVLVVDDEDIIRKILSQILERDGYSVAEATNGKEALVKMADHAASFVITDIRMPEMNGLELLIELKDSFPGVRVAIITGHSGSYPPKDLIAAGADQYILKPFKKEQIRAAMLKMEALDAK